MDSTEDYLGKFVHQICSSNDETCYDELLLAPNEPKIMISIPIRFVLVCTVLSNLLSGYLAAQSTETVTSFQGKAVRFANAQSGRKIIGEADEFVRRLSDSDRRLRMNSKEPVDQNSYLKHAAAQVKPWDEKEVDKLTKIIAAVEAQVRHLKLEFALPDEIVLIKTTGHEEAGPTAPYTRGQSIVFTEKVVANGSDESLTKLFLHELFHVLTRHEPKIRGPLYEIIGFKSGREIEYPAELLERKLTNPDAYHFDSYVELEIDDAPAKVLPLTLTASTTLKPGGVMSNLTIEFLEVEADGPNLSVKRKEGKPVLHGIPNVMGEYMKQIGLNTSYIIHPEEIMADNFAMAIQEQENAPNPEILEAVLKFFADK